MAVDTKWDTSKLSALLRDLKEQRETIERNKDFLININREVETAWQGYAGRTFDQRMEIDVENLETFIKNMDDLIDDIDKVIKDCYEECENDIEKVISQLKNVL